MTNDHACALFRFSSPDKTQLACIRAGDVWTTQSRNDFIAGLYCGTISHSSKRPSRKPREYLAMESPIRERMVLYRSQGILADEAELLGKAADAYGRIVSMYLAKAASLFAARRYTTTSYLYGPKVGAN